MENQEDQSGIQRGSKSGGLPKILFIVSFTIVLLILTQNLYQPPPGKDPDEIVAEALRRGTDTFITLCRIFEKGGRPAAEAFLKRGLDVNEKLSNMSQASLLALAASEGRSGMAEFLIDHGAQIDSRDSAGFTPLMRAARAGSLEIVQLLLANKADPNASVNNFAFQTVLYEAKRGRHREVSEFLLRNGVQDFETSLHHHARFGDLTKVSEILRGGADVNGKSGPHDDTPLIIAAENDHPEVVKLLLEKGARVDEPNRSSQSALFVAAYQGNARVIDILIASGADVNWQNSGMMYQTPLHMSAFNHHRDAVRSLLAAKAKVNLINYAGNTPLHSAMVNGGDMEIAEMLINSGADVNARNQKGETPLHTAMEWCKLGMVELLVKRKAEVNAVDNEGRTPLAVQRSRNRSDSKVIQFLEENGAKVFPEKEPFPGDR